MLDWHPSQLPPSQRKGAPSKRLCLPNDRAVEIRACAGEKVVIAAKDSGGPVDPAKQAMLLAALYIAQEQRGFLSPAAIERVAQRLGLSPGQVYTTASFYTLFHTHPVGRYVIQVCDGLSCYLCDGAERIADYIGAKLGILPGETTADGLFTLELVECLASCGTAPAMRVNDQLHENLTPEAIDAILEPLMGED